MAEIIVMNSEDQATRLAAGIFVDAVKDKANAVWGLATGSTPIKMYEHIARIVKADNIDISNVRGFALDEYVGLPDGHPESYRSFIEKNVIEQIGLDPKNVKTPNGNSDTLQTAGSVYEMQIATAGGVDVQILGIGTDGHIGFNEPGSSLVSRTRIKTLTKQTREDNSRFFASIDDVPIHCITQGIGTIMDAKHLVLLAFGEKKADAIYKAVEGPITSSSPGSMLQMHPRATFIIDEAAASKLQYLEYYKWAYENKPNWQGI
ncbi:MAG: glucosamine-6-phosphate deaminase [Bifidobacteriaceae bacterium]|jgi:glucosamine-6-phosphate deaminase|nr:glucosamine-6-phosphate deaminase [Bifidobacteriaceae bacterium]